MGERFACSGRRFACVAVLIVPLLGTVAVRPGPKLVWNATASMPVGLYAIVSTRDPALGDTVLARVPEAWRALADRRAYIPAGVPLIKRVAGVPGDKVCAWGSRISVNSRQLAWRLAHDARQRALPWWEGCLTLRDDAVFLLSSDPSSFDGRYLGPTSRDDILGRARLLWAR
jgi:conjugative transfer signal peptidase TraF